MTDTPSSTPGRGARTFRAAWVVLASVAAAQAAATAWSVKTAELAVAAGALPPPQPPPPPPAVPPPADPFRPDYIVPDDKAPERTGTAGEPPPNDPALALLQPPQPVVSVPAPPPPKPHAPLDVPITDESVLSDLDEALTLRSRGDMKGAIDHLRTALKKLPDHPKLLYHTARTLDTMGLAAKAVPYWKSLFKLGEGAGDFFVLAQERMAGGPQILNEPEEEKQGKFSILDLRDEKVASGSGERITFTAVLKKVTPDPVDVREMVLVSHFFDTINGQRIARSQVAQPVLSCSSEPLDWSEGTETFTFEYFQPEMAPAQLQRYGRCRYYGCTLEVIYQDQLQDVTATTPELLQLARELPLPPPEPEESILETGPAPAGSQPESSLFPRPLHP